MVIMNIMGGLGNQLYQYAFGRWVAHKLNTDFKLDLTTCRRQRNLHHNYYRLNELNIIENIATPEEIKSARIFKEDDVKDINEILNYHGNIYLYGYWNLEKYFIGIRAILLQELTLKNPLGRNSAAWRDKIISAECAVSLHVRMGDFLLALVRKGKMISYDFYEKSIAELKKENPNLTVFVFSDDLAWCKENLKFDVPTEFVEGCEYDFEELYLMSLCTHNVLGAATTFSWWGAWLNRNPDKKVFVPDPGIRNFEAFPPSDPERDIPKNWIRIPIDYTAWEPAFSIIICVENNSPLLSLSLNSVLAQNFKDYEVIIVDASTDGSGKICRQTAVNDNVTILTVNSDINKFAAWNRGLNAARGEYILFLTTQNFILETVAKMVAQLLYDYLKRYLEPHGKYLQASNYGDDFPNIISGTQYLAEDAEGNINLNVILNKSFSIKADMVFKNLNLMIELNPGVEEKLVGLATKGVNNFVCTKFFKRKFLAENKITFKEKAGGGTDAELLFLVDTFLATDKITFVPQVFGGRLK